MQLFRKRALPSHSTGFIDLKPTISHSVTARLAGLSGLSGYPVGSHVVGRLQNQINFASYKTMLESLLELRNLARLAGDILYSAIESRVDKQAFVRTELLAYVSQQAEIYGFRTLTTDQKDLIAYMIASNEAVDNAWILDFSKTATENRIHTFSRMYKSLISESIESITYDEKKKGAYVLKTTNNLAIYDPQEDKVTEVAMMNGIKKLAKSMLTRPGNVEEQTEFEARVKDIERMHRVYALRVVDHVMMLMMDTTIWDQFVTPRSRTDKPANEERAKGLKLFASYLNSLLMYPHMMEIMCFFNVYDKLERDFVHFPQIPAHLLADFDNIIKNHDYLGAAHDAAVLMGSCDSENDTVIKSKISVFFKEYVTPYGLEQAVQEVSNKIAAIKVPVELPNLDALKDAKYGYLLYSHAAADFNTLYTVTERLRTTDLVASQINAAVSAIMPGLDRFFSGAQGPALERLNIRVPFDIVMAIVPVYNPMISGTNAVTTSGVQFDLNCIPQTRDVRGFIRKKLYTLETASKQRSQLTDIPRILVNRPLADLLEGQLKKGWPSLLPTSLATGNNKISAVTMTKDWNVFKGTLESITGMNINLIQREISNPYAAQIFATYFSSFMCLYMLDTKPAKGFDVTALKFGLVEGYGKPYGSTYAALSASQPPPSPDDLIEITTGVYGLIHKEVPVPVDVLSPEDMFDIPLPYYVFAANSLKVQATEWVMAGVMDHFALLSLGGVHSESLNAIFDKRFGYMADSIVLYDDSAWDFTVVDRSKPFNMAVKTREWNREKLYLFLKYKVFGDYYAGIPVASAVETPQSLVELTEKVEAELTATKDTAPHDKPETAPGTKLATVAGEEKTVAENAKSDKSPRKRKDASKAVTPGADEAIEDETKS